MELVYGKKKYIKKFSLGALFPLSQYAAYSSITTISYCDFIITITLYCGVSGNLHPYLLTYFGICHKFTWQKNNFAM